MDKELIPVADLPLKDLPINKKWSWDRILRSPYIKQADTLQSLFWFEDNFTDEELKRHFDFYEPITVHESSLSPCVHSILGAKIGYLEKSYELRHPFLPWLLWIPDTRYLKDDPRFKEIVEKMNLPK